jgi:DNA-binding NarL/FixJ family response regulator
MLKILIVDDHEIIGQLFAALVRQHFPQSQVFVATSLQMGMRILENHKRQPFSLAVIDLVLEGEADGTKTVSMVRKTFSALPILVVSGLDAQDVVPSVFRQGAHGFLSKFCSSEDFIKAIRCVLQGEQFVPAGLENLITSGSENLTPQSIPVLSNRQIAILELLSSGFSDKRAATQLGITEETIAYHLQKVFRILNASTRTQAIAQAFRHNLLSAN